jgi:aryl-alcohol dehydrogenase-like predicted oxidoreductase
MEYRYFGNTGIKISCITFGAQTFGWNVAEKEAHELLDYYEAAGGNYIDIADSYNQGDSERIVGTWFKKRGNRERFIIGTKVFFPTGDSVNDTGLSRKHIFHSMSESLDRLGTDYIDLYQLHCFDQMTPIEETLHVLNDLVHQGKIHYIGASNFTPSQMMESLMISRQRGWAAFCSLQLEYSLLVRSPEWELIPVCKKENIGTMAWSPLAGGWLTGKFQRSKEIPAESRAGRGDRWDDGAEQRGGDFTFGIIDVLNKIAAKYRHPVSQVSLNWMLQRKNVTAPLIGARTLAQLKDNLGCLNWKMDEDDLNWLDDVSNIPAPYPYSFINRYTRPLE